MRLGVGSLLALSTVVGAQAPPPAPQAPPRARLTEDLRLDAVREDFPRARFVWVGPKGEIAVPIDNDMNVRLFDSTGRSVATIGRPGSGPGEFREMYPVGWKRDTLWVHDNAQRRVSYFGPDYKLIRTARVEAMDPEMSAEVRERLTAMSPQRIAPPASAMTPMALPGDGLTIAYSNVFAIVDARGAKRVESRGRLVAVGPGRRQRILAELLGSSDERWGVVVGGFTNRVPFATQPMSAVSSTGDRVAQAWGIATSPRGGALTVTVVRSAGDTAFTRTLPFTEATISAHARDSALASLSNRASEAPEIVPLMVEEFKKKMPPVYPGMTELLLGLDETVWIGRWRTAAGQEFLVLNGKGDPIATVHLAPNARLRQASATKIYVTETDADGLVSVVRYRVSGIR